MNLKDIERSCCTLVKVLSRRFSLGGEEHHEINVRIRYLAEI
jgi:hypothetical protein